MLFKKNSKDEKFRSAGYIEILDCKSGEVRIAGDYWTHVSACVQNKDNLNRLELKGVRLKDCNMLKMANFSRSNLEVAHFDRSDLRMTDFSNADLSFASFEGCDLRGAGFIGATLSGAIFRDAQIDIEDLPQYPLQSARTKGVIINGIKQQKPIMYINGIGYGAHVIITQQHMIINGKTNTAEDWSKLSDGWAATYGEGFLDLWGKYKSLLISLASKHGDL